MIRRRRSRTGKVSLVDSSGTAQSRVGAQPKIARYITIAVAGVAALLIPVGLPLSPRLVWNESSSAPIGLYVVTPGAWLEPHDMVVAWPPEPLRQLAAKRRYLPSRVPLVKRVAAYGGDMVCARGEQVFINGRRAALRQLTDGRGRPMPNWGGCILLRGRQLFLLADNPASFDGRYFGVTDAKDVIGKARLLWNR